MFDRKNHLSSFRVCMYVKGDTRSGFFLLTLRNLGIHENK